MAEPIPFSKPSSLHHVGIATYVAKSLSSARPASLSPGQKRRLQEQQRFRHSHGHRAQADCPLLTAAQRSGCQQKRPPRAERLSH